MSLWICESNKATHDAKPKQSPGVSVCWFNEGAQKLMLLWRVFFLTSSRARAAYWCEKVQDFLSRLAVSGWATVDG